MARYEIVTSTVVRVYPDHDKNGNVITYGDCGIEGCPFENGGKCLNGGKCINTEEECE